MDRDKCLLAPGQLPPTTMWLVGRQGPRLFVCMSEREIIRCLFTFCSSSRPSGGRLSGEMAYLQQSLPSLSFLFGSSKDFAFCFGACVFFRGGGAP